MVDRSWTESKTVIEKEKKKEIKREEKIDTKRKWEKRGRQR